MYSVNGNFINGSSNANFDTFRDALQAFIRILESYENEPCLISASLHLNSKLLGRVFCEEI